MERKRLRTRTGLVHLLLVTALGVGSAAGCSNSLDKARTAWADGEGDFEEAEPLYKEAIAQPKTTDEAKAELAAIYCQMARPLIKGKAKQADALYAKALEIDPGNEEALEGRARALMARQMPDKALEIIEPAAAKGDCRACKRLLAVLLIDRGDRWAHAGYLEQAEADYDRSLKIIPNATVALQVAKIRISRKNTDGAAAALEPATVLIGPADTSAREHFLEMRKQVVLMALAEDKPELADKLLDLAPTGVGADEQAALALEVAGEARRLGKPDAAIERLEGMVEANNQGKLKVSAQRKADMFDKLIALYVGRSSAKLAKGDVAGSDADLARALEIRPGDPLLQLQRVLTAAGSGDLTKAQGALDTIDAKTQGYNQVFAILASMRVHELVKAGRIEAARVELAKAKSRAPDLPEVHVATAELLVHTEFEPLKKADAAALVSGGLVKYDKKVTRLTEALSEIDWSRQSIAGLGSTYPYRGPGTEPRMAELEAKIKTMVPFAVKFNASAKAVVVLENKGSDTVSARLLCKWTLAEAKVAPGQSQTLPPMPPGFCELTHGGKRDILVAEPYTEVKISI